MGPNTFVSTNECAYIVTAAPVPAEIDALAAGDWTDAAAALPGETTESTIVPPAAAVGAISAAAFAAAVSTNATELDTPVSIWEPSTPIDL
jgi:hypothetical protein